MIDYKDPKAVLEVCGKATEGPWEIKKTDEGIECPLCGGEGEVYAVNIDGDGWTTIIQSYGIGEMIKNNADFIALARTALPYWVEEAERLRAENEMLKSAIINNSNVIVNTPELPESFVIKTLQQELERQRKYNTETVNELNNNFNAKKEAYKEVAFLQSENARLREENDMHRAGIQELSWGKAEFWNCFYCGLPNHFALKECMRCGIER